MSDGAYFGMGVIGGAVLAILLVGPITQAVVNHSWEREAVAIGVAEYYKEGPLPIVRWRWLPAGDVLTEDE